MNLPPFNNFQIVSREYLDRLYARMAFWEYECITLQNTLNFERMTHTLDLLNAEGAYQQVIDETDKIFDANPDLSLDTRMHLIAKKVLAFMELNHFSEVVRIANAFEAQSVEAQGSWLPTVFHWKLEAMNEMGQHTEVIQKAKRFLTDHSEIPLLSKDLITAEIRRAQKENHPLEEVPESAPKRQKQGPTEI